MQIVCVHIEVVINILGKGTNINYLCNREPLCKIKPILCTLCKNYGYYQDTFMKVKCQAAFHES